MSSINNILRSTVIAFIVCVVMGQAVLAATVAQITGPEGLNLHWDVAILSFIICTLSGIASLLQRIATELKASPGPLPNPVIFCAANLTGSWAAGALAFVSGQSLHLDVWMSLGSMIVASYVGARYIEAWSERRYGKPEEKA